MKPIFEYADYRIFLKDYYASRKAEEPAYSFRVMGRSMGFASPNFLKLIMEGKRNIGKDSLPKICEGLGLKKKEAEYFSYLVFFQQAKDNVEKNYYFGLLAKFRTRSNVTKINADQYDYYKDWYNSVVRELVPGLPVDVEPAELARRVRPEILPKQAKKAVKLLLELGMIKRGEDGRFALSSPLVSTDREVRSLAVRNFHAQMLQVALKALAEVPPEKRDVSSVTMRVSRRGFDRVKQRIQEFREEIMQMLREDDGVDRVYQFNLQFFPVSYVEGEE